MGKTWERLFDVNEYLFDDDAPGEGRLSREKNSVVNPGHSGNNFELTLLSTFNGEIYFLEFKNSLSETTWTSLPAVLENSDGV